MLGEPRVQRVAESTNQSIVRCLTGSSFYKPYDCNVTKRKSRRVKVKYR